MVEEMTLIPNSLCNEWFCYAVKIDVAITYCCQLDLAGLQIRTMRLELQLDYTKVHALLTLAANAISTSITQNSNSVPVLRLCFKVRSRNRPLQKDIHEQVEANACIIKYVRKCKPRPHNVTTFHTYHY